MKFIDCHAHLNMETEEELELKIKIAKKEDVHYIVCVNTNPKSFNHLIIENKYKELIKVIGVNRTLATGNFSPLISILRDALEEYNPSGIGEIGLDYQTYWGPVFPEKQQEMFRAQLRLAREFNLPFVIHSHDADKDLITLLEEEKAHDLRSQIHGCICGIETYKKLLDMGLFLSFGYIHLIDNKLRDLILHTPVERILTETDSPYAPTFQSLEGDSQPAEVPLITKEIAKLKGLEIKEFTSIVLKNAKNVFRF